MRICYYCLVMVMKIGYSLRLIRHYQESGRLAQNYLHDAFVSFMKGEKEEKGDKKRKEEKKSDSKK